MTASSVPAILAKSAKTSTGTCDDITVWWAAPEASHDFAEVTKLGRGFQKARPTGS